jgi:acetylornithine/N-succinyldiaminopimelate aminotransferase
LTAVWNNPFHPLHPCEIFVPRSKNLNSYVMPTYGRFDLAIARGEVSRVWDEEGKEYFDFGAALTVELTPFSSDRR